jgi:isopentenyl diphosphate isomerase/L-lactate dehydrogenase-like FMN-dependent dehydrogenase
MPKVTPISSRKSDHIRINLEEDVRSGLTTGLERYTFIHQALPNSTWFRSIPACACSDVAAQS